MTDRKKADLKAEKEMTRELEKMDKEIKIEILPKEKPNVR